MRRGIKRAALFLVGAGALVVAGDAMAIIGRPLTPVSFAGAARRSVRRNAYAGAAYGAAAYGAAAYGAAAVTALPPGCVAGAPCGGVVYRPVYHGTTVVYVP